MINIGSLARAELAGLIVETLADQDIEVVLVGGSCVCVYTNERFASLDLDFIDLTYSRRKEIAAALALIGFQPRGSSRYFEHTDCQWTVEFPTAPLAIGHQQIGEERIAEMETSAGTVRLLNPTDCAKDRLLNYYLSGDQQCLAQAIDLAQTQTILWAELKAWHEGEDYAAEFDKFRKRVNPSS